VELPYSRENIDEIDLLQDVHNDSALMSRQAAVIVPFGVGPRGCGVPSKPLGVI